MTEARDYSPKPIQLVVDTGILTTQNDELRKQKEEAQRDFDSAMAASAKAGKPVSEDTLRLNLQDDFETFKGKPTLVPFVYQNQINNPQTDPNLLYQEAIVEATFGRKGHEMWAIKLAKGAAKRTPDEPRYAYAWRYLTRKREARSQRIMGKNNRGRREFAARVGWSQLSQSKPPKTQAV